MYITFQNIKSSSIDFESLIGKYLCFLSKGPENLNSTVGTYVTNCNFIYRVLKLTDKFIIVESDFHGNIVNTKLKKDTFEKDFFNGGYIICDSRPNWGVEVGTYNIKLPDYKFESSPDLNKSFTTEEINELLTNEFLNKVKSYEDVKNCIETVCDIIMKRHFKYVSINRSYFQQTNSIHVGLSIESGKKFLDSFGHIELKSYRNKITSIKFEPFNWLNSYQNFKDYVWTSLEDLIIKYLNDNQEYINNLK